jgi:uncharacterized protein YbjT (DUF2867 family)
MQYLITGATGTVGTLVTRRLIERGERPRIFVRDRGKAEALYGKKVDVFTGDLAKAETMMQALTGSDVVFLVNSGEHLVAHDAAASEAAKAAGVKRLVKLSSFDANVRVGTGIWHAAGEAAIRKSGIAFTFVQPSGFMSNALFWAHGIRKAGVLRSCTGDGKISFIHPRDIADVSVEALGTEKVVGQALPLTGPESLSYAEMAAKIGKQIGRVVGFEPIGEDDVRRSMAASGDSEGDIEAHLSIYRGIREGKLAGITDTIERVLGRKPLTFDRWIAENISAFIEHEQTKQNGA